MATPDGVSRARSAARDLSTSPSIPSVPGCAPPSTRRAIRPISTSVVTASRRSSSVEENVLCVKNNISNCHADLGREDEALAPAPAPVPDPLEHTESTLVSAANLAVSLHAFHRFAECRSFALERIVDAERVLGAEHNLTVGFRKIYAVALCSNPEATQSDTQLAIETLEGCVRMSRRVMGKTHPRTLEAERLLGRAREQLAAYGD